MLRIFFATPRLKDVQAFAEALASNPEVQLTPVVSGADALEAVRNAAPHLVTIDADLPARNPWNWSKNCSWSMPW
jgi:hypothetical protein